MSLDRLIDAASIHYTARRFPEAAVNRLKTVLGADLTVQSGKDGEVLSNVGKPVLRKPVLLSDAIYNLPPNAAPERSEEKLGRADAIFAFSFGYRVKSRPLAGVEARLPGANNRELALISAQLKTEIGKPLFAQFEIADAIADHTCQFADVSSPVDDLGTGAVAESFLNQAQARSWKVRTVAVVAHEHHMTRCLLLLRNDFNIEAVPAPGVYWGYDEREAQPRVVGPEEFIVSDCISMIAHPRWHVLL